MSRIIRGKLLKNHYAMSRMPGSARRYGGGLCFLIQERRVSFYISAGGDQVVGVVQDLLLALVVECAEGGEQAGVPPSPQITTKTRC